MLAVVFDVWHTLLDPIAGDEEYYGLRVRRLLDSCGLDSGDLASDALRVYMEVKEEVEGVRRETLREVSAAEEISAFLGRLGVRCEVGPDQLEAYAEPFLRLTAMRDGAAEVVRTLRSAGLTLGVLANSPHGDMVRRRLSEAGLSDSLEAIVCSGDVGYRKPHPAAFKAILREMGVQPADAVMVGDDPIADVEGARAAGMRAVWVAREGVPPPKEANAVVEDLRDLLRVLRELGWLS